MEYDYDPMTQQLTVWDMIPEPDKIVKVAHIIDDVMPHEIDDKISEWLYGA